MSKVTINVTQRDIEQGAKMVAEKEFDLPKFSRSACCPIALAAKRKLGEVRVSAQYLFINGEIVPTNLPEEAQYFVREFDAGGEVEPFEFRIEI